MSNRLANPNIQFLDNEGEPLVSGKLYFYVTGTTTPTDTYNNADLAPGHTNTNPITLDAAGRAGDIFLDPTVVYKCVLKDSSLATIWTADPVVDLAANAYAKFQIYAGNPNGNVAGYAGAIGGVGASVVWDSSSHILYICTTTGDASAAVWVTSGTVFDGAENIHTADYTVVANDAGVIQVANKASTITFNLTAVATLGPGFLMPFKNIGAGTLVLNPAGSELIDDQGTFNVLPNQGGIAYCNGSLWRMLSFYSENIGATKASFYAHKNAVDQSISSTASTKVTFATSSFNVGSYYSTGNARWTPPAGKVLIAAGIHLSAVANNESVTMSLNKNGSLWKMVERDTGGTTVLSLAVTVVETANGSDYFEIFVDSTADAAYTVDGAVDRTWFTGSLL